MIERNFMFMLVFSLLTALAAGGVSYLVCLHTNSIVMMFLAMLLTTGVCAFFVLRWWLRVTKSDDDVAQHSWKALPVSLGIGLIVTIALAGTLAYTTYALTGSRISEIAVGLLASLPGLAFLAWKGEGTADPPKPQEARMLRFRLNGQIALAIIFSLNAALQMRPMSHDYGISTFHNLIIAMYVVVIPFFPVNAFNIRKRLRQSR